MKDTSNNDGQEFSNIQTKRNSSQADAYGRDELTPTAKLPGGQDSHHHGEAAERSVGLDLPHHEHTPKGPVGQDSHQEEQISTSYLQRKLEISMSSKGKQKHRFGIRDSFASSVRMPESSGEAVGPISLAQRFQELVEESANKNTRSRQFQDDNSSHRLTSIPIVDKFRDLMEGETSTSKAHKNPGGTKTRRSHIPHQRLVSKFQINNSTTEEEIEENADGDEDSGIQERRLNKKNPIIQRASLRTFQKTGLVLPEKDIEIQDTDEDNDGQETRVKGTHISEVQVGAPLSILDQFQDALLSAGPTVVDGHNESIFDSSGRLQRLLLYQKSKQHQFSRALQKKRFSHGLSQCVEVLILEKHVEGQLVTCRCEVLRAPEEWNSDGCPLASRHGGSQNASSIRVIFSSKISPELGLEIGIVVRVHPPWQEIPQAESSGRIIFGTFFCELVH